MTILFDSHIHFQEKLYLENNFAFCCGINPKEWNDILKLSQAKTNILPFFGLHPWQVEEEYHNWQDALENIVKNHICGIGETGLDGAKNISLNKQKEVFIWHLKLAQKYNKPVVIHMVKAYNEVLAILKEYPLTKPFMIHAYSGSKEMVKEFAKLGAYFSVGRFFIKKDLKKQQAILQEIPKDRLLIETDSQVFDSFAIKDVALHIANVMNISCDELIKQTNRNAFAFWGTTKNAE